MAQNTPPCLEKILKYVGLKWPKTNSNMVVENFEICTSQMTQNTLHHGRRKFSNLYVSNGPKDTPI